MIFLSRKDTLPCFKQIPLNLTLLPKLHSPMNSEELISELCGFLILSSDVPVEPHELILPVFLID